MKQLHIRGIVLFLCLYLFHFSKAQSVERKLKVDKTVSNYTMNAVLKTPSFIGFKQGANLPSSGAKATVQNLFGLGSQHSLQLISATKLPQGILVEKYKDYFKGIVVEHSAYNVVSKNGVIQSVFAEAYAIDDAESVTPQYSTENAKAKAVGFVHAEKYAWEAVDEDKKLYPGNVYMQQQLEALKQQYTPKAELVIAKDVFGTKEAKLAYKFDILAVQPLSRYLVYVDALTGKILVSDAVIKHANKNRVDPKPDSLKFIPNFQYYHLATNDQIRRFPPRTLASVLGTAHTRYAGVRQIYTTKIHVPLTGGQDPNNPSLPLTYSGVDPRLPVTNDDVYILKDDTRGGGIETYDLNGVGGAPISLPDQVYQQALAFVDRDNDWKDEADNGLVTHEDHIRGATHDGSNGANEAFNDDIALDAHWGASVVYDYWKQIHNRLSYDNKNTSIRSYVHYGPAYDNAFWNGSVMTYGDGSGTINPIGGFRPLTSLDVCGHEIGHGVCSFTADLVYQGESGAMNEALSDIWAANIEHFAKTKIDATLQYQEFQIGEQIAADNIGLRRMDNPKAYSNPDTYGGVNWQDPNCTPTLANDECGVHNNSGVLNHWYYLLVKGPKSTTGLPTYTDDGIADNGSTENAGNNYGALPEFIGLDFAKAEQIAYLMELSLTPNATYADARVAAINAAKALYGACSQEEKSTTDAWFAVGVGAAWSGCTAPTLEIDLVNTTVQEGSGECGTYTEYPIGITLTVPQGTTTTINVTVDPSSTAEPHDYQLTTNSITYAAGETGIKPLMLRVFNDDMVEGDETVVLHITSSGGAVKDTTITFTIKDDDVAPKLGGVFTLLNENFDEATDDVLPAGWGIKNNTNPSGGAWTVAQPTGAATKHAYVYPVSLLTGNPATDAILKRTVTYDSNTPSDVILRTPLIDARGFDSVRLHFLWSAGGEAACSPACDYGEVVYSLDGINFQRFSTDSTGGGDPSVPLYLSPYPKDSTYSGILGKVVSNRQFYLGFRWINDANGTTGLASISIDSVIVSGIGRKIESDSLSAVTTSVHVEPGAPVYFYSRNDKGLLSSIVDANLDLGCVNDTLIQAGNGTVPFKTTKRTRKVHQIAPSQNSSATYTLTLFYTAAEVSGFTVPPSQLQILKSNAADIDQSTGSNSVTVTPTFIDSSGQGFYGYRATFNGFSKFALVEPLATPLAVTCLDFKAAKGTDNVALTWKVGSDVQGSRYVVERSSDGVAFNAIGTVPSNGGGQYAYADKEIAGLRTAYYRVKEVAAGGDVHYLCTVLYVPFDGHNLLTIGNVFPNPGKGEAVVSITSTEARKLRIEYVNAAGQIMKWQNEQLPAGASRVNLNMRSLAAGSYLLRFKDEDGKLVNTQQFIRQ